MNKGCIINSNIFIKEFNSGNVIFEGHNELYSGFLQRLANVIAGDTVQMVVMDDLFDEANVESGGFAGPVGSQRYKDGIAYRSDGSSGLYRSTITTIVTPVENNGVRFRGVFQAEENDMVNSLALGNSFADTLSNDVFQRPIAFVDKSANKTEVIQDQFYEIEWEVYFSEGGVGY